MEGVAGPPLFSPALTVAAAGAYLRPMRTVLACLLVLSSAADASARTRCRTLSPSQARLQALAGGRPDHAVSLPSADGYPFWVHGPAGTTAYVTALRDVMDYAWQVEIVQRGWAPPLPDEAGPDDGFDVYVDTSLDTDEAGVDFDDEYFDSEWDDATSYMSLPEAFSSPDVLVSTVVHELNHASQFALDAAEDDAFYEHTAVLVEQQVAGFVEGYGVGIADYQQNPRRALDYIVEDYYEYGAALWLMFLAEAVGDGGDALVQALWTEGRQATFDWDNEPDFLDTLPGLLAAEGWDLPRFFGTFALWRYYTGSRDDGAHFAAGDEWGADSLVAVDSRSLGEGLRLEADLAAYGAKHFLVSVAGESTLAASADEETVAALEPRDGTGTALGEVVIVAPSEETAVALPEGTAEVLVALTRLPEAYDPEDDEWGYAEVGLALVPPGGSIDDGTGTGREPSSGDPEDDCSAVSPGLYFALLALAALRRVLKRGSAIE